MTNALEDLLADRIERDGPMPFAAFMSLALYHPKHGYYGGGVTRTGWRGHFVTSPELDPAFGALWANGFRQIWEGCGRPSRFQIVEVGAGEGGFCEAVMDGVDPEFATALSYTIVERVPAVGRRQRDRLSRYPSLEWAPSINEVDPFAHGCVFANEVLDNLPVHLVERREGRLLEICVERANGDFVMTGRPPPQPELEAFLERAGVTLADGHRYEVQLAAESFVSRAASLIGKGALVLIDYGSDARTLGERPAGSLLCYSANGIDDEPLVDVGNKDITTHVNWTTVGEACRAAGLRVVGPKPQRAVLRSLGSTDLDQQLREVHDQAVAGGRGADALGAISRRQALGALADPAGLGGFDVIVGLRGIDPPPFLG